MGLSKDAQGSPNLVGYTVPSCFFLKDQYSEESVFGEM